MATVTTRKKGTVRLPQEQRVSDIMAAARQVISEKGYENTLMSEIAERAGVVEGTLYRYFDSKRDLMTKVADAWFEEVLESDTELPRIQGTRERLRYLIWRALMSIRRQPAMSRFMLLEVRQNPDYRHTRSFELNKRMTAEISLLCGQAIERGEFRRDVSVPILRDLIFGCIEHRTWSFLRGEGDFDIDEVADGIANVIYRGMAAVDRASKSEIENVVERLEKVAEKLEERAGGKR
ncbi:MAG: TetR/AcrR family transcriptional regulator [Rhodobiaceae bacterium]|nr:TetR/AcrR family transcriptional regulator [Rhodobiaceae bacterium]MCC0054514.1 TetR/AcrR family transcriptional regulator [Rhodobiaceae bacterium]